LCDEIYEDLLQCTEACTMGGTSSYNFIKRNLERLISNELAQQYSWLGAKLKRKFCNLRIADMLLSKYSLIHTFKD